ncbi:class I SAM-dependent DNA methyltransferase [Salimicrobium flavidum]|uniref:Methyltransferase domain-containing protein n=1 Tax=Salimicrobium flavidum TaxID=570947 RepID=A0A1N7II93_9BACI|nr:class I SAM-dependent methyltransferase [Salimicrobium flavidum]SIS36772.1 Methyltransferase domain-containing protein [Salimicrobium flavidum]
MSYVQLAGVYDRLMEDAPYEEWKQFFMNVLDRENFQAVNVLELGCGTGEITRRLAKEGFQMTGVDLSEEMLAVASRKYDSAIQWMKQDITKLEGFSGFDAVISFCDVVNYITVENDLEDMFHRTNLALEEKGLFVFDIHSPTYALEALSGETFAEVYDDLSYIWFCDAEGTMMTHDLTFFIEENGSYQRFDEEHHQRIYELQTIHSLLGKSGFHILSVHSDFSMDHGSEGDRIFFVCQKV